MGAFEYEEQQSRDRVAAAMERQADAMEHIAAAMIAIARKHGDIPD